MLIAGRLEDTGDFVWNGGNVYVSRRLLDSGVLSVATRAALQETIRARGFQYRANSTQKDKLNRHGHGRIRPSFFAFGFSTLHEYVATLPEFDRRAYIAEHASCCGVVHYVAAAGV